MPTVVSFGTLSEMLAEIRPGVKLRLSQSNRWSNSAGLPAKDFHLDLTAYQGGELLVLHWSRSLDWGKDGPAWPRDQSRLEAILAMKDLVREFLLDAGHNVRPGIFLIPADCKPHRGIFDCLKWEKTDDEEWSPVSLVSEEEWAARVEEVAERWYE